MENIWTIAVADGQSSDGVVTMETGSAQTDAQTAADGAPQGEGTAPQPKPGMPSGQLIMIVVLFAVMYFLLFRGPRKQQKEQAKMRNSIQKNDRVLTIGGIYGTVLDVKDKEVTIKIDESTNTKMKISLNAISSKVEK
jgi:preprotein translocase subunit YajC